MAKKLLKQIIILLICLFLLLNMKNIMMRINSTALGVVAICIVIGTTVGKICDIFGGD